MPEPRPRSAPRRALLAGGGSGGHVFPGLAVAHELAGRGWEVDWAGSPTGMEARLVPARGFAFHPLKARPVAGRGPLGKARAAFTLAGSSVAARRLVRRLGSAAVLGTGGYVSAPAVVGARLAGRPCLLLEPNAEPGLANRALSRFASEAAVAHESAGRAMACPFTVTGVPVRAEFFAVSREAPPGAPRLLVLGGSQGARRLNRVLPAAVARLRQSLGDLVVLHQTGEASLAETAAAYAAVGLGPGSGDAGAAVTVVAFLDDVAAAMAESRLVLSRAGAITLAEIAAAGRGSLLVPLGLAGAHQVTNARAMEAAGAARQLGEDEATSERLETELRELLLEPARLAAMGAAARRLARRGAAAAIADRFEALGAASPGGGG